MTVYVRELDRRIDYPRPPDYYSSRGKVAWERGVSSRCAGAGATNPYRQRYMRRSWIDGWHAAQSAIAKETV